jgi:hypothetical protein
MVRTAEHPQRFSPRRRVTAAALKQATARFLQAALPPGWSSQPLAPPAPGTAAADLLVISPRGRCHFLFVRAPADRWWDSGPHAVPAEQLTAAEAGLARRLRAAGHRARPVWGSRDLARALNSWGCTLRRRVELEGEPAPAPVWQGARPGREKLHLATWGGAGDA